MNTNPNTDGESLIRLRMNAQALFEASPDSSDQEVKNACQIANGNAGAWHAATRDFTSKAFQANKVKWMAQTEPGQKSRFDISLDWVEMEVAGEESQILDHKKVKGNGTIILADVKDTLVNGVEEHYIIAFTIEEKQTKAKKSFKLDPKLKGDTSSTTSYLIHLLRFLESLREEMIDDPVLIEKLDDFREYVKKTIGNS